MGVGTLNKKHLLRPFPIAFGARLALFEVYSDMVLQLPPTKDVVFAVFGADTVLLLNTGLLPTVHIGGSYVHDKMPIVAIICFVVVS